MTKTSRSMTGNTIPITKMIRSNTTTNDATVTTTPMRTSQTAPVMPGWCRR